MMKLSVAAVARVNIEVPLCEDHADTRRAATIMSGNITAAAYQMWKAIAGRKKRRI
jgi:hypothetical protein